MIANLARRRIEQHLISARPQVGANRAVGFDGKPLAFLPAKDRSLQSRWRIRPGGDQAGRIIPHQIAPQGVEGIVRLGDGGQRTRLRLGRLGLGAKSEVAVASDKGVGLCRAIEGEGGGQRHAYLRIGNAPVDAARGHAGVDPLVFPGVELVVEIGGLFADIIAPTSGAGAVAQLGAQDLAGVVDLALIDIEKLTAAANRREQIGYDAARLAGVGGFAQIVFGGTAGVDRVDRRHIATTQQSNRAFELPVVERLDQGFGAEVGPRIAIGEEPEFATASPVGRLCHCREG